MWTRLHLGLSPGLGASEPSPVCMSGFPASALLHTVLVLGSPRGTGFHYASLAPHPSLLQEACVGCSRPRGLWGPGISMATEIPRRALPAFPSHCSLRDSCTDNSLLLPQEDGLLPELTTGSNQSLEGGHLHSFLHCHRHQPTTLRTVTKAPCAALGCVFSRTGAERGFGWSKDFHNYYFNRFLPSFFC